MTKSTLLLFLSLFSFSMNQKEFRPDPQYPASYREAALRELREVLQHQEEWVKVHAAEYLLWAGYPEGVRAVYLQEEKRYGTQSPYRIGIWRVLAQVSEEEKSTWTGRIQRAFGDPDGPDRIHAAETLAKLKVPPTAAPEVTRRALESDNPALALYTRWAVAHASPEALASTRQYLLDGLAAGPQEVLFKRLSGYILRNLGDLTPPQWQQLARVALAEPATSDAQVYLLSAAYVRVPAGEEASGTYAQVREKLLGTQDSPQKAVRSELAMALAEKGTLADLPVLLSLLTNKNPLGTAEGTWTEEALRKSPDNADVRAAAAYAILKIEQRYP
ncbi:hypothetical protein GCM10027275_26730 [Rhabdobacter roseus]